MQVTAIRKCRGKPTRILMCDVENINGRKKFDLKKKRCLDIICIVLHSSFIKKIVTKGQFHIHI